MENKEPFQLLDITKPEHWENLLDLCHIDIDESTQAYKKVVLYNLLCYLKNFVSLQTVLIEHQYIDKDYRNEFSHLYSKTFKKYQSICKRLHLFQKRINTIETIKSESLSTKALMYLGYIIVRPLDVGKAGRTVITDQNNKFNPDRDYVLCTESFTSHLFGKELKITGSPYIQQDSMVMTCAQASIWMAARYMHQKFGFPCHLPYDITESASASLGWVGRALPSEGLTVYMMLNALNNMGYSPVFSLKPLKHDYTDNEKYEKAMESWNDIGFIYKHVESQIPVILMMPEHAITVIGHTFDPKPRKVDEIIEKFIADPEPKKAIISSHHWVDGFIIHDDHSGPYKILPVSEDVSGELIERGLGEFFPAGDIYKSGKDIEGIIVPLPEKIYLLGIYIDKITNELISDEKLSLRKVATASDKGCKYADEFLTCLIPEEKNPLVTRSYFIQSEQYKEKINKQPKTGEFGLHEDVKKRYLNMRMPRFIWVTEITSKERLSKEHESDRTILGEIILDTTANKYYKLPFLAIHFPGVLIEQDYDMGELLEGKYIPNDRPYRHITRQKQT